MSGASSISRALVSVHDKSGLIELVRGLQAHGVEVLSTGGTARAIAEAGVPVTPIDAVTGFPEMLDGRVKTLHPAVHGGILHRRDDPAHVAAIHAQGIRPIDLVIVNLYPFEATIARSGVTFDEVIEQIDIGGPSMVRSAAKNHAFVTVITDPSQYEGLLSEMREHGGGTSAAFRRTCAAAAFARTAIYDGAIAAWMSAQNGAAYPPVLLMPLVLESELRYGENPHQAAAAYRDPAWRGATIVGGQSRGAKALSYNNLLDASAAFEAACDLALLDERRVAACVVKHTNPCGAALAVTARDACMAAWAGDPLAAYGGIVALSAELDLDAAEALAEGDRFVEVIVAPSIAPEARERLAARWKNLRLVETGPIERAPAPRQGTADWQVRSILGGWLVQERDAAIEDPAHYHHAAGPAPSPDTLREAAFAMTVAKHLKSNAICVVRNGELLGAGAGQMDRVSACGIAVSKATQRLGESSSMPAVAASDAFFPFADGPRVLIDAGVRVIVHPGGSKRDEETFALCNERGVTCLITGRRHFRH